MASNDEAEQPGAAERDGRRASRGNVVATPRDRDPAEILSTASRLGRIGAWHLDAATQEIYSSPEIGLALGFPEGTSDRAGFHPEPYSTMISAAVEACLARGESFDVRAIVHDAHERERACRIIGEAERNETGEVIGAVGSFQLVDDDPSAENTITEVESFVRSTLDQVEAGIFFLDTEWRLTFLNATASRYLGRTVGQNIRDVAPTAWKDKFGEAYRTAMELKVVATARQWFPIERGWFEAIVYPTADGIAVHFTDVTEQHEASLQLERVSEQLREQAALLDAARDAIFVRKLDNRVAYWNQGAERIFGWPAAEMAIRSVRDTLYKSPADFDRATEEVLKNGHWDGELEQITRDGRIVLMDCRWQLEFENHEPSFILCVESDVTVWMREQRDAIRAQRMESLGTLAGGVAHDLNNVLTPMLMASQLLIMSETDATKLSLLETIESGVTRGADMIRQVLLFARGEEGERSQVSVGQILGALHALSRDILPKSITVSVSSATDLLDVVADSTQLLQVLLNLVTNARDAMDAGEIMIRASTIDDATGEPRVLLEVEDTGSGMTAEVAARIFEPFYTTKELGQGTGLGLSTSMTIVRSHGGSMSVYSEPGWGSVFSVELPAVPNSHTHVAATVEVSDAVRGSGQLVLVIDDEPEIRASVCRSLIAHGFTAIEAAHGLEAADVLAKTSRPVDLVITDMMMPVMGGAATIAYLAEHHPTIPIIAASGLTTHAELSESGSSVVRFMHKPYSLDELLEAVAEALG